MAAKIVWSETGRGHHFAHVATLGSRTVRIIRGAPLFGKWAITKPLPLGKTVESFTGSPRTYETLAHANDLREAKDKGERLLRGLSVERGAAPSRAEKTKRAKERPFVDRVVADLVKLGAKRIKPPSPGASEPDGGEFEIRTPLGLLEISPRGATVFAPFDKPDRAVRAGLVGPNGKWNHHFAEPSMASADAFKARLVGVLGMRPAAPHARSVAPARKLRDEGPVLSHARTSKDCKPCSRFHSEAEHGRHAR